MQSKQAPTPKAEVKSLETLIQNDDTGMYTTSLIIAEAFGKEHKNVLRDIENLGCSPEFRQLSFEHTPYIHPQNGESCTFQQTDYTNVFHENEEFNVLKEPIRTWEFFYGHKVHCIEYYICTSTNIPSIQEVAPKDIRKLIFSAFCGFIERFPNPKNPPHKAEGTV